MGSQSCMTTVVCVIEPEGSQFIGAYLLQQSLAENAPIPYDFRLTILLRRSLET